MPLNPTPETFPSACADDVYVFPASFAQRQLWLLDQQLADPTVYNVNRIQRLEGLLDLPALEAALTRLVARHESLRTTVQWLDGQPQQVIAATLDFRLSRIDLSDLTGEERLPRALELAEEAAGRPFDLGKGPLFRALLLVLSPQEHLLVLGLHHIISDAWSLEVLLRDLKALYRACLQGGDAGLPNLSVQYSDFAHWQAERLQGARLETSLAYWRTCLEGVPAFLDLPLDHPRPPLPSGRGARIAIELPGTLGGALRAFAQAQGTTLFMVLLAGYQVLLGRWTQSTDFLVGCPIAGRTRPELEPLIGCFVNMLPFRADLSGDPTVTELLKRVRATALGAFDHQDLPFEKLVEELEPQRSPDRAPLVQAVFAMQNVPLDSSDFQGLFDSRVDLEGQTGKFDLGLTLWEGADGVWGELVANTDILEPGTLEHMRSQFLHLLEEMPSHAEEPISSLRMMDAGERLRVLQGFNRPAPGIPAEGVHRLFEVQAARNPEATAVVFGTGSLSYGALNRLANRLARRLRQQGIGPDRVVALFMERSLDLVVGILGILKAGGAYLPLDASLPKERLAFMLKDTGAGILLTQEHLVSRLPECEAKVFCLDLGILDREDSDPADLDGAPRPGGLVYVMYTSGSTGRPKGVEICHSGIVRLLFGIDYVDLGPDTVTLLAAPISFDASTFELWAALLHGGTCVLYPEAELAPGPLGHVVATQGVNTLWLTTVIFNALVDEAPQVLAGVDHVLVGGEALSVPHIRRALNRFHGTRFVNSYGPTEATTFTCCHPIPRDLPEGLTSIPIGRPIGDTVVHVLDATGEPVPVGVPGELHVGGPGLARGYRNLPDLTRSAFIPNRLTPERSQRLYRTGDQARYLADGTLEFLVRKDCQVKLRGHRIELGEIEAALALHPAVVQGVAQVREGSSGDRLLVAYIKPRYEPTAFNPFDLMDVFGFLRGKLPPFMVPNAIGLVAQFPTKNGKLDRRRLQDVPLSQLFSRHIQWPSDPTQALIARIWEELLGVASVGAEDDFFELGGHSMLAFVMVARVEALFGQSLSTTAFYAKATIRSLSDQLLAGSAAAVEGPVLSLQAGGGKRPFFFLHGDFQGGGFYARNLSHHLGEDRLVCLVHPPGMDGLPPAETLEAVASRHLPFLRSLQPKGPYQLGGHCNGALEALEMARQLLAAGEEVALLVMLDPPDLPDPANRTVWREVVSPEPMPSSREARARAMLNSMGSAIHHYVAHPLPVPVLLAGGYTEPAACLIDGWRNHFPDPELVRFPGNHFTSITDRFPEVMALVRRRLEALESGRESDWANHPGLA